MQPMLLLGHSILVVGRFSFLWYMAGNQESKHIKFVYIMWVGMQQIPAFRFALTLTTDCEHPQTLATSAAPDRILHQRAHAVFVSGPFNWVIRSSPPFSLQHSTARPYLGPGFTPALDALCPKHPNTVPQRCTPTLLAKLYPTTVC